MSQLILQTSDAGFINSGDMRLILTGHAPTVVVGQPAGLSQPDTGTVSFSADAPAPVSSFIQPGTGSLSFVGHGEGWGVGLTLQGYAPSIDTNLAVEVPSTALDIAGIQAFRGTGLQFEGQSIVAADIGHNRAVPTGVLAFTGVAPQIVIASAGNYVVAPETYAAALSGQLPGLNVLIPAGSPAALALAAAAPSPGRGIIVPVYDLAITSEPIVFGSPTVIIAPGPESGTAIVNADASADAGNRYNICDVSGFKAKPGELRKRWDGYWVLPEFWEPRNDQDFVVSKAEKQRGAKRPEPVGSERFIEDEFPSGVTADDL